jgi:hypothetical protein
MFPPSPPRSCASPFSELAFPIKLEIMLRKMYLVSADKFNKIQNPPKSEPARKHGIPKSNKRVISKKNKNDSQHAYNKWVEMRDKLREDEIRHNTQIRGIADFLQKFLPQQSKKVSFKSEPQLQMEKIIEHQEREGSRLHRVLKPRFLLLPVPYF